MGNINYNNFICENYYCQSVSFKPEWLSENSWNIKYNYLDNTENIIDKPYIIDKGILKMNNVKSNHLLLSKKLLINFSDIKNITIPIIFKYLLKNDNKLDLFIIFTENELELNNIDFINNNNIDFNNNLLDNKLINKQSIHNIDTKITNNIDTKITNNIYSKIEENNEKDIIYAKLLKDNNIIENKLFFINLRFIKNGIYICNSFDSKIIKKKIKSKKINKFDIQLENNYNMLLITENLLKIFEEKYLFQYSFESNKEYYLNLYINSKNGLLKDEYIELNFE